MREVKFGNLLKHVKCLFLAYDQGLEHGPSDFNDDNVDPLYILNIAKKGGYNGIVFQKGIAQKYRKEIKASKVPLILKLNGKTNLNHGEPLSTQLCTVAEARKLGAVAVGYTIYIGSEFEPVMMREFEVIEREAHQKGMPVIAWIYPRGKAVEHHPPHNLLAYCTRVGLEIGADMVKVHWNSSEQELEWAVQAAGRCKVVVAGGLKTGEKDFIEHVKQAMNAGVTGVAVGRNVWQSKNPLQLTEKLKKVIWG